jgi:hypothetical protein
MGASTPTRVHRQVTCSIPVDAADGVRRLVEDGGAASQTLFVSEILDQALHARRTAHLRGEIRRAAGDPDFLRDVADTMGDFATADAETAGMIP